MNVQVRPVSVVTVTLPVEVTASEKVTLIGITAPTGYAPSKEEEVMLVMVGGKSYVTVTLTVSTVAVRDNNALVVTENTAPKFHELTSLGVHVVHQRSLEEPYVIVE